MITKMSFPLSMPNTSTSANKKHIFSSLERELIVALVRERPVLEENKGNDSINRELRRQAWEDVATVFNNHPDVTQRTSIQLKKCWENMKSLRKKELSTTGRLSRRASFLAKATDKVADPYLSAKNPRAVDPIPTMNGGIVKVEIEEMTPDLERTIVDDDDEETLSEPFSKRCQSEMTEELPRRSVKTQQDRLLELKIQRESILLEREKNTLEYEKKLQELQLEKIRLEIEILKKNL